MTRPIAAPPRQLSLKTKNTLHCIGLVPLRCTAAGYPVTMSGPGFCIVRRRLQFWQIWEDTASLENFNNNAFRVMHPKCGYNSNKISFIIIYYIIVDLQLVGTTNIN